MSITAVIEQGVIRLPKDVPWKSGTPVSIEAVEKSSALLEAFKDFDGMTDDLPADLATNVDHYVHVHPRS